MQSNISRLNGADVVPASDAFLNSTAPQRTMRALRNSHADVKISDQETSSGPAQATPVQSMEAKTPIQTANGVRALEDLVVGDRILSRNGTFEPITRIDRVRLTRAQLNENRDAAPVRFDAGALPMEDAVNAQNASAVLMSADCTIPWANDVQGVSPFPARAFCDGGLIREVLPEEGIHYIRLHFATTLQIEVCGIWVELSKTCNARPVAAKGPRPVLTSDVRVFRPIQG